MKKDQKDVPQLRFPGYREPWPEYLLGDLYKERNEKGNDSLPILSVSIHYGVSDDELDTENLGKNVRRSEDKSTYKHVYPGDLIFNMMRAWQGAIGVAKSEGMISPAYISAIPSDKIYPPFMDYQLRRVEIINQINNMSYGVTDFRKRLYWNSFVKVSCRLPSVDEQEAIAEFLKIYDILIALQQRKLDQIKENKKGLLQKMFPKNGEYAPEVRFPGFTDDWEQRKLCDMVSLRGRIGFRGYTQADLVEKGNGAITFSPSDIDDAGNVSLMNNKYVSWAKYEESPEIKVQTGDILFTKTASIGKIGFVRELKEKATINPQFALLTPLAGTEGYFTFLAVRTEEFMRQVRDITGGSSVPTMPQEKLKGLTFMVPSSDEQKRIGRFFESMDNLITFHQRKLDAMKEYKKGLLQQMFV